MCELGPPGGATSTRNALSNEKSVIIIDRISTLRNFNQLHVLDDDSFLPFSMKTFYLFILTLKS